MKDLNESNNHFCFKFGTEKYMVEKKMDIIWMARKDAHFSMISHKNWSTFTILVLANLSLILDIQWPRSWLEGALERKNASSSQHQTWTHKIWSNIITVCNQWYEFWVLHYHKIIFDTKHSHIHCYLKLTSAVWRW